ncbi:MAG: hypothetical protein AAGM29_19260 [Cyanobacteria bacterium J06588_4]
MNSVRYFEDFKRSWDVVKSQNDDPILVVCPKCQSKALILPDTEHGRRCVCTKCSFYKSQTDKNFWIGTRKNVSTNNFFYLELWLHTEFYGNTLYACTQEHLNLLESYIKADLRERRQDEYGWRNSSLISRLPKWIKSHKNREQLLKAIQKLRKKL